MEPAPPRPTVWPTALSAWGAIVAAVAVLSYFYLDLPVTEWANALPPRVHHVANGITQLGLAWAWLIPLAMAYVICANRRLRRWADLAWLTFWTVAASGLGVDVIKWIVARRRPTLWFAHHEYGFEFFRTSGAHTGFPSGHSATIASICAVLWFVWPRWRLLWLLLALAVGASRVFTGSHYPSDVIVGLYLGVASTVVLHALLAGRRPWGYPIDGPAENRV